MFSKENRKRFLKGFFLRWLKEEDLYEKYMEYKLLLNKKLGVKYDVWPHPLDEDSLYENYIFYKDIINETIDYYKFPSIYSNWMDKNIEWGEYVEKNKAKILKFFLLKKTS